MLHLFVSKIGSSKWSKSISIVAIRIKYAFPFFSKEDKCKNGNQSVKVMCKYLHLFLSFFSFHTTRLAVL
jgi:hypothetical protein